MPIRPYEATDREAVRTVCYETGYMGEPIAWQWRDKESFADLFSGYYTDYEPQSLLVAELDGQVVGYLLGCMDSRKPRSAVKIMRHHVFGRGIILRPGTAGFILRSIRDGIVDSYHHELAADRFLDDRWPAHLHINLLPQGRGQGLGGALVREWLDRVRGAGLPGCHLETLAENTKAIAFFEAMGFERKGAPHPAPGMRSPTGERHHVQLLVQSL